MNQPLANAQRIVVKIGSALLVDAGSGHLRGDWLASLCADIAELKKSGKDIVIVSSGAIALGRRALGLKAGALKLEDSQAAAAVGQVQLAKSYAECLAAHDITAAQILLTLGDTEERRRYLNARATLKTLLAMGAVPVINENDTVATAEIRYGDNDRLAARVSSMMGADALVLLSDVDGLYSANPTERKCRTHRRCARHHTRHRSNGRRFHFWRRARRHGLQTDCRKNRDAGRCKCDDCQRRDCKSAGGAIRRRARYTFLGQRHTGGIAQTLDRGRVKTARQFDN